MNGLISNNQFKNEPGDQQRFIKEYVLQNYLRPDQLDRGYEEYRYEDEEYLESIIKLLWDNGGWVKRLTTVYHPAGMFDGGQTYEWTKIIELGGLDDQKIQYLHHEDQPDWWKNFWVGFRMDEQGNSVYEGGVDNFRLIVVESY